MSAVAHRPRIIFFTGLGCDERMVAPHYPINADIEFQPWLDPIGGESLVECAIRMAQRLDVSRPYYLAGISLGGMVAQEVAIHLAPRAKPEGLILLSTCRSALGVPWTHRIVSRLVAAGPDWFIHFGKTLVPHMRHLFGLMEAKEVELFEGMMGSAKDASIRWSLQAIAGWKGGGAIDVPTFQVHAERDRVLPLRTAGPVDVIIEGAGHAMTVTRAAEVNTAVNRWLRERSGATGRGTPRPVAVAGGD